MTRINFGSLDPALSWRLHWTGTRETWSIAGEYRTRTEAENAIAQLGKIKPGAEFKIEYIGRGISHHNDGSVGRSKF